MSLLLPLVWIILSAAKHEDVKNDCVTQFSSDNSSVDGDTICNIFTWIQLGQWKFGIDFFRGAVAHTVRTGHQA